MNDSPQSSDSSVTSSIQKANLVVPTDLSSLSQVLSWFDRFNHPPVPKYIWMQCQLAVAEAFTNAVRHAHKNYPPHTPIEMQVAIFPQRIEIRIWDSGQPFNLIDRLKTLPAQVDRDSEGGRGLPLLNRIADNLTYTQTSDQRNCLLIVKHFSSLS